MYSSYVDGKSSCRSITSRLNKYRTEPYEHFTKNQLNNCVDQIINKNFELNLISSDTAIIVVLRDRLWAYRNKNVVVSRVIIIKATDHLGILGYIYSPDENDIFSVMSRLNWDNKADSCRLLMFLAQVFIY